MGIVNIDVKNISLYGYFDEEDPNAIILIRLLAWHIKFEKRKELKKKDKRRINVSSVASQ